MQRHRLGVTIAIAAAVCVALTSIGAASAATSAETSTHHAAVKLAPAKHRPKKLAPHDAADGESTSMVSVASDGTPADSRSVDNDAGYSAQPSADGSVVAFYSADYSLDPSAPAPTDLNDANGGIYVHNTVTGVTTRVDREPTDLGPMESNTFQLSEDGTWIAFVETVSSAPTDANPYPYHREAFLENLTTGNRIRISSPVPDDVADADIDQIVLSADGTIAAFVGYSGASDDWHQSLWIYDRTTGTLRDGFQSTDGGDPLWGDDEPMSISGDGSTILFASDLDTVKTDPQVPSDAGDFMYTLSTVPGALPVPVMLPDNPQQQAIGGTVEHSLSYDGSMMEFAGIPGGWTAQPPPNSGFHGYAVFVLNRKTDVATQLSTAQNGDTVEGYPSGISDDGKYALFDSNADNIVSDDDNDAPDVFWTDLRSGVTSRLDVDPGGSQLAEGSGSGLLSGDGQHLVFVSHSSDVVYDYGNGTEAFETTLDGGLVANVQATPASHRVALRWRNPRHLFGGAIVRGARGTHPPKCRSCGFAVYRGRGHRVASSGLHNGKIYSYAVFTKDSAGKVISRKVAAAKPVAARHRKHRGK